MNSQQALDEVRAGDTDLQKWMKVTSWAQQLASGLSPSAGETVQTTAVSSTLVRNSYTTVTAAGPTTQTLPAGSAKGTVCAVKNQGAGTVTVSAGSAIIYSFALVSTYQIGPGAAATFTFDGTYWNVT